MATLMAVSTKFANSYVSERKRKAAVATRNEKAAPIASKLDDAIQKRPPRLVARKDRSEKDGAQPQWDQ